MNSFIKTASVYTVSNIIAKAIQIILFSYLAHSMSLEEMGKYALYSIYLTIISFIMTLEIRSAYGRFYFEYQTEEFEFTILNATIIINIMIALVLFLNYDFINNFISIPINIFLLLLIIPIFDSFFAIFIYKVRYKNYDRLYAISTIVFPIILLILFFILQNFYNKIFAVFLATLLAKMIINIYLFRNLFKQYLFVINFKILKEGLKFSIWLVPSSLGSYFSSMTDRVMLEKLSNTANVGIYSVYQRISQMIQMIIDPIYTAFTPKIMKHYKEDNFEKEYFFYLDFLIGLLIIISFFVALFSKETILILAGEKYIGTLKIIYLFLFINIFIFLSKILEINIHLSKKSYFSTISEVSSGMLNIILNYFFIKMYGIYGAIYATFISFFVRFLMYDMFARKLFNRFHISLQRYGIYFSSFAISMLIANILSNYLIVKIFLLLIIVAIIYMKKNYLREYYVNYKKQICNN